MVYLEVFVSTMPYRRDMIAYSFLNAVIGVITLLPGLQFEYSIPHATFTIISETIITVSVSK